jgi:hypothetical protein
MVVPDLMVERVSAWDRSGNENEKESKEEKEKKGGDKSVDILEDRHNTRESREHVITSLYSGLLL